MAERWIKWWGIEPDHPVVTQHKEGVGVHLWLHLIYHANYKNGTQLKRGQLYGSVRTLSEDLGIPKSTVHRILRTMESEGMITLSAGRKMGRKPSVITICNYERYQSEEPIRGTERGTAVGQSWDTSVRREEGKKKKEMYDPRFIELWKGSWRRGSKRAAYRAWQARLREGVSAEVLHEAVVAESRRHQKEGTEDRYQKHVATFLGPDEHWREALQRKKLEAMPELGEPTRACKECKRRLPMRTLVLVDEKYGWWICRKCLRGKPDEDVILRRHEARIRREHEARDNQGREGPEPAVDLPDFGEWH